MESQAVPPAESSPSGQDLGASPSAFKTAVANCLSGLNPSATPHPSTIPEELVALTVREYPQPLWHKDGPSSWEEDYTTVMTLLQQGHLIAGGPLMLSTEMRAKIVDLLGYMLEALGRQIPVCLKCRDTGSVQFETGQWGRCPDCL